MPTPTFFTVVADYRSVVADEDVDPDADPQLGPVTARVTFRPAIETGGVILAADATPRPTGFVPAPIVGRIDTDGRLKLRVDSDLDVDSWPTMSAFPATGSANQLYRAVDTDLIYRWSGTTYVETVGFTPIRLLADTPLLELAGPLYYTVVFSEVRFNGQKGEIAGFTFPAPNTDTEVNLIEVGRVAGTPTASTIRGPRGYPVDQVTRDGDDIVSWVQEVEVGRYSIGDLVFQGTIDAVADAEPTGIDLVRSPTPADARTVLDVPSFTEMTSAIDDLIDGAPGTRDTLKEISDALTADEGALAALTSTVAGKADTVSVTRVKGGRIYVADYGTGFDGTTDNRAAIVAALAAATPGSTVVLPPTVRNSGAVIDVPDDVALESAGVARSVWLGFGITIGNRTQVRRIDFNGTIAGSGANGVDIRGADGAGLNSVDPIIEDCAFRNWLGVAVNIKSANPNPTTGVKIRRNQFFDNATAVFAARVENMDLSSNTSKRASGSGRHFTFYSNRNSVIHGNRTEGGITGILHLSSRTVAGPRPNSYNTISDNVILNPSEEGISFDIFGNDAAGIAVFDWGTVKSRSYPDAGLSQAQIELDDAFLGVNPAMWLGYRLVVTTGAAAGFSATIDDATGVLLRCNGVRPDVFNLIQPGDEVVIGNPSIGNTIIGNKVTGAGTFGIGFWGFAVGNTIVGNTVHGKNTPLGEEGWTADFRHGIEIWGADGLVSSTSRNYTTRKGRAPCVNNRVRENTLVNCDSVNNVKAYGAATGFTPLNNDFSGNSYINADHVGPSAQSDGLHLLGAFAPPAYVSGNYYFCNSAAASGTSATLANGRLRTAVWLVLAPVSITRLAAEFTVAGDANSVFRIGVWNDDGFGRPGTLVLDAGSISTGTGNAGTVATGGTPGKYEIPVTLTLQPGVYHVGGAVQGVTTTQPTMVVTNSGQLLPAGLGATTLAGLGNASAFFVDGATGAFTNFATPPATSASGPARVAFKVA